ncbi:hypothetical protein KQI86_08715 [Clostridium sp. MSJ-11]|uniref:Uncharacterized protein n=1 Tax=Clostridium mobile TaxID=2841512 RepID=A0ABS6EHB6_9CLOT|nr:hypothetical protein [Clostridium mobile]MBU5484408.1 hypothetical protein [Clostridium mobile]
MRNNEKFIKNWEKYRKKGKAKYILTSLIVLTIGYWSMITVLTIAQGKELNQITKYSPVFIGLITGNIIMLPINWNRNEERYHKLLQDK